MDSPSPSRHSAFSAKNSFVDVSQLDKVNAIPNKTADNVLLSNLCPDDQHYLKFLMENDSSTSEDELEQARRNSSGAWSPMIQSRVMSSKRSRALKPSYAITLSLEDISYIRPSWGMSKGIRTIEVDGKKNRKKLEDAKAAAAKDPGSDVGAAAAAAAAAGGKTTNDDEITYKYFLLILTLVVVFLTLPPYYAEQRRLNYRINRNKLKVDRVARAIEFYRPSLYEQPLGEPMLRLDFGQGIPANLKPEECSCDVYQAELEKRSANKLGGKGNGGFCSSCLDWAVRANLRVLVEHQNETSESGICYSIKWQSYDNLATPLIDCLSVVDRNDQWFGLGDIRSSEWPLTRINFDSWTPLATNLSSEFSPSSSSSSHDQTNTTMPSFGSQVNFTLFSTSGASISELKSDFRLYLKREPGNEKKICIKATCSERCGRAWSRADYLEASRFASNILEYKICSSSGGTKSLIADRLNGRVKFLDSLVRDSTGGGTVLSAEPIRQLDRLMMVERESHQPTTAAKLNSTSLLPEGIGLIDRTIFMTSAEFMPVLDGKTLRQYVDGVVKMGLKTSSIIMIDSRWETHVGSLQLNTQLFPKWRLLFEIIHNKGFKVVLTMKPYVDTVIGASAVQQLLDSGKLYEAGSSQRSSRQEEDNRNTATILRRTGLFAFRNESIELSQQNSEAAPRRPFVFKCKESQVGYCALLDLSRNSTRGWLGGQISRSELLASNAVDGIVMAGAHPDGFAWEDHYRVGLSELVRSLYFRERIFTLPQWTGDLGYIQLASRPFSWDALRSVVNSVLNLSIEGFSLVHPGSVWGDLKSVSLSSNMSLSQARKEPASVLEDFVATEKSNEELCIRWLQVGVFLPILQFNNLAPIERYNLQDLLQNLIKIRKLHIISELKRNLPYTPLISHSKYNSTSASTTISQSLIRPVWFNQQSSNAAAVADTMVGEQFTIGADILVAPVLSEATRQRDIYLPNGFWHDELRQNDIRGGKWLRNYPVELNEIAWFTRAKR